MAHGGDSRRRARGPKPASAGAGLAAALAAVASEFSPKPRAAKRRLLAAIAAPPIAEPAALVRLHEALCLLHAYPADAAPARRRRRRPGSHAAAPSPHRASPALAGELIETARVAMVTRSRELHAFSYPNVLMIRAKGGRGEGPYVRRFLGLAPLARALEALVRPVPPGSRRARP